MSEAGVCARRTAEAWILAGRVSVNGTVVTVLGTQADPEADVICVDGKPLVFPDRTEILAFYKPRGVMVTRRDPEGRPTVYDYLPPHYSHLKTVGRLDFASEGLLLLTNDGDLQHALLHPSHEMEKRYTVWVSPPPSSGQIEALKGGAGTYQPVCVTVLREGENRAVLEMVLREGKNRQIRRMLETLGVSVSRLKRTHVGPIELGDMKSGEWREIKGKERAALLTTSA